MAAAHAIAAPRTTAPRHRSCWRRPKAAALGFSLDYLRRPGAAYPQAGAESLFPCLLEHQSRIDQTLFAVVMERSRTARVGAAICPRHPVWVWFSTDRPVEGQPVLASPSADALAGREHRYSPPVTLKHRLAALDRRLLPGQAPGPSAASLRRAAFLYALAFLLAVVLGVVVGLAVEQPSWLGGAVSGAAIGLLGALLLGRLVRRAVVNR